MPDLRRLMKPMTRANNPASSTAKMMAGTTFMVRSLKLQTVA
jgi:hypothetical protein